MKSTFMVDEAVRSHHPSGGRPLNERLGANIARRRKAMRLTQAQLAESLDVDTETLSRFERGKHLPSLLSLERLAGLLHATVADLLAEQPHGLDADGALVMAWLAKLDPEDRSFVFDQIKVWCDHLDSKRT